MSDIKIGEEYEPKEERPQHRVHEHLFAYHNVKNDGTGIHADFKDNKGNLLFSQDYANIGAYWRHVEELRAFYLKKKEEQNHEGSKRNQGSE